MKTPTLIRLLMIFVTALTFTMKSNARTFYFSNSGSDSYSVTQAQNSSTPWKTLQKLQSFATSGAAAGDTFAFKCGDVFIGLDRYGSVQWGSPFNNAPSGTASNPIVFTSYGSGAKPNFLFPTPSAIDGTSRIVFAMDRSNYLVFDGLQFNDNRFPINDKVSTCFTKTGILIGEESAGSNNCIIRNCSFNNIGCGIEACGNYITIENNIFTNMKNWGDTATMADIGCVPMSISSGKHYLIKGNYMKGAWGFTGATASGQGLNGTGIELVNDIDSSTIIYNTIIDCAGAIEYGNITSNTAIGANHIIFAYNKFINNGVMCYLGVSNNVSSGFHFWNNVYVENQWSRFSGPRFGTDIYGDGQSFAGFTNWPTWPKNPSQYNYGGFRIMQYPTDATTQADTLIDSKNNILWMTTGLQAIYPNTRTKFFHRNNVYHIAGSYTNPTVLGGTLGAGEISTTGIIITDSTNALPENWNFHLTANSLCNNAGYHVGSFFDFDGNATNNPPDIGIYETVTTIANPLIANASFSTISCFGGTTNVTVTASGGTSPYYGTGIFNVSAGNYSYIVTDGNGNRDTVQVVISQPAIIAVNVSSGTITTTGGTTTVQVTATGGTGNYTYSLNGGAYQSSATFNAVPAGNHSVNVKDANGCISTKTFTINAPVISPLVVSATSTTILCNGGSSTITVGASGGVAPYTGTGSYTVNAGTFTYNVTDANGTTQSTSITVGQPSLLTLSLTAGTITVYGGTTSITANATGGTGTKNYSLNNGVYQTSNIFSGVSAGVHTVNVKDANGCIKTATINISQPAAIPLTVNVSSGNILCNGGNTTLIVSATGGTAPYVGTGTYTVTAGTYSYTVTDAAGNTSSANITVSQPSTLNVTATAGNINTYGGTTSVTCTANGGVSPYSFKLNGGSYQSSNIFNGIAAGNHTITVMDVNGCTKTTALSIAQPTQPLSISAIPGTINCNGGSTNVIVSATGGTAPYTGIGTFSVVAGTYQYTVTDANGVSQTASVTVTQPSLLSATAVAGFITITGGTTTITINANGGTNPYTYLLNGGNSQSSNVFSGVSAGTHTYMVKDTRGCLVSNSITVFPPASSPLVVNAVSNGAIACNGGTTIVTVSASGGTAPYSGTGNFTVGAGTRTFTVRDASGISQTTTLNITQPSDILVTVSVASDISVNGGTTPVTVAASGGASSYRFSIDGGASQSTGYFRAVGAGNHYTTVVDANGCAKVVTFTVNQIETGGISVSLISKTDLTCKDRNDGTIEVMAQGGRAPYTYKIGNGVYGINNRFYNLAPAIYRVYAKDANNNVADIIVEVKNAKRRCPSGGRPLETNNNPTVNINVNIFPNPSTQYFKLNVESESMAEVVVEVIDINGRKLYNEKGSVTKTYQFGQAFRPGVYFVRVIQDSKIISSKIVKQ